MSSMIYQDIIHINYFNLKIWVVLHSILIACMGVLSRKYGIY